MDHYAIPIPALVCSIELFFFQYKRKWSSKYIEIQSSIEKKLCVYTTIPVYSTEHDEIDWRLNDTPNIESEHEVSSIEPVKFQLTLFPREVQYFFIKK